jgi:hypothetical protein
VKVPVTCTCGGVISGYWLTGRFVIAMVPINTITIEITIAVTGLLINVSAIIFNLLNNFYVTGFSINDISISDQH